MRLRSAILHCTIAALAGAAMMAWPRPAQATPISCGFTITSLSFGTVDLTLNTTIDSTATLSANCTGDAGTVVRVCPNINAGSGGTTTGSPRFMLSGSDKLNFDLYQDSARTVVWGSYLWAYSSYTAPTIDITLNGGGSGSATATIYGRISSGQQSLPPGSYSSSFSGSNTQIAYAAAGVGNCAAIGNLNATSAAFTASATYSATCSVNAANLNFGSTGVLASALDGTTSLTATCSATTPYTIGLDGGNAGASDPTQRKMANGGTQITYGLYQNVARSQPWGNTTGTNTVAGTGTGSGQSLTVYGRVPAQTTPAPGTYSDSIIATLTY
jgi:spore coat protein U domain-containing protein, fimbrial subunit CupE1/2/3/6